jgi:hypothetical protein
MNKLSGVLVFILAFALPLSSYTQQKVQPEKHLNGDQTHQGRHIRIFSGDYSILRFELYNYN